MLKLKNVSTHYGDVQALQDVSFEIREGEIVSIIGSNGAGKSTTLNTISGILRCSLGTIEFLGARIDHQAPHQIVDAGIVQIPEGRLLFPYMTVLENLELGSFSLQARRVKNGNLKRIFSLFPVLKERMNQLSGTLSGGEQQMVAIARGLMSRPKLLMLDEPSLGLAPLLVSRFLRRSRGSIPRGSPFYWQNRMYSTLFPRPFEDMFWKTGMGSWKVEGKSCLTTPRCGKLT